METHGRERRWRYFTVASYRAIIANEKLDDQDGPYSSADFSNVGHFAPLVAEEFYVDTAELNRFVDYGFNRMGLADDDADEMARKGTKSAMPTTLSGGTVRGKKRGREEAGLDTDPAKRTPRKRGRPRKHPVESQLDGPSVAKKIVTLPRGSRRSLRAVEKSREAPQQESTGSELRGASHDNPAPPPRAPKKRRRPSDDNYIAPEGSKAPRRRDGPSMRPPTPPLTGERVERPHSRNGAHTLGIHFSRHPSSEPRSPKAQASEVEAQPASKECGHGPQSSTDSAQTAQPTVSDPRNHLLPDPCAATLNSNGVASSQFIDPESGPNQTVRETVASSNPAQTETLPRTASLEPVSAGQKRKEKSAAPQSRSNVSLLRRENEFLRILEESGGITHPGSKEFLDAHLALLDTLTSAGEPTSGLPGVKVDKRTIENTFESLERRCKVKVLKTAISTTTGAQRPIRIIYFPTVDQSKLDAFLTELGKGPHSAPYSVDTPSVAGVLPGNLKARRPAKPFKPLQPEGKVDNVGRRSKRSGRTDQPFEQTIHDVLLTEGSTLPQLYKFVPEQMMGAPQSTPDVLLSHSNSPIPAAAGEKTRKKQEWEAILKAVHPHPLERAATIRVARVRKRYLRSGESGDKSRWENEVRDAIRDPESSRAALPFAQRKVLAQPSRRPALTPTAVPPPAGLATPLPLAGLPPVVASQPGKSIEQLIKEQGPARENAVKKKRKSKKSKDGMDFLSTGYNQDSCSYMSCIHSKFR